MTSAPSRQTFEQAAAFFLSVAEQIEPGRWEQPGLGVWTVRELVGHTNGGMLRLESFLDGPPAGAVGARSAVDYFAIILGGQYGSASQVAERGRQAGAALGDDPLAVVRETVARVPARLARADDEQLLETPVGGMRLRAYLPTRIFELTVHSLDLAAVLGLTVEPPPQALAESLELAAQVALRRGSGADVLLALTGRRPLPTGFSIVI
jgi:uncharacterized protein (TIGR03083 family)